MRDITMSQYTKIFLIIISLLSSLQKVYSYKWDNITNQYSLFEITAFNVRERAVLYDMQMYNQSVIFLNGVSNIVSSPMYVMVKDTVLEEFEEIMYDNDIEYIQVYKDSILQEFHNLKAHMEENDEFIEDKEPSLDSDFLDWDEILMWVKYKLKKNPTNLRKYVIGHTYENRELIVLKVYSGGPPNKPRVFILGGEQGRDKMSPAVLLRFIDQMLTTSGFNDLIQLYDFYLMPVFNPDGYEYSFQSEIFFNKNRKHFYPERICDKYNTTPIGVNIDRNWFSHNANVAEGAECDPVFIGHDPISEEEPKALSNFLNNIAMYLMAFINVRGFSSLLTVPYAQENEFANNYPVLSEILLHASNVAFIKYNASCNLCSTHNCFYNMTGNAPDWVKRNLNVPVVFTLYLKHAESFLPRINQVPMLLRHFAIIVKETLLLSFDIYGPLYSAACRVLNSLILVTGLCIFYVV